MKELRRENGGKKLFTSTTQTTTTPSPSFSNVSTATTSMNSNNFFLNTNLNHTARMNIIPTKHFTYSSFNSSSNNNNNINSNRNSNNFDQDFDNSFKFETKLTNKNIFDSLNSDIWNIKNVNLKIPPAAAASTTTTNQNQIYTNKSRYNNTFFKQNDSKLNNNDLGFIATEWNRQLPPRSFNDTQQNKTITSKKSFDDEFDF